MNRHEAPVGATSEPVNGLQRDADIALMLAFQSGDEEAFVQIYQKHKVRIFNYTRRILGNAAHAEEAAQDVFLKLYQARQTYKPQSKLTTFLYRIATNHCLNLRARHEHRLADRQTTVESQTSPQRTADVTLHHQQLRSALTAALATLPEKQSAAFVLCHYEGLSYQEASLVLKASESAIKSLVHRAREKLLVELRDWITQEKVSHVV